VRSDRAHLARRVAGLGGTVAVDTALRWGTSVNCTLRVRAPSLVPETAAAEQIAQLRPREREVPHSVRIASGKSPPQGAP
jgi:hypothetical protein